MTKLLSLIKSKYEDGLVEQEIVTFKEEMVESISDRQFLDVFINRSTDPIKILEKWTDFVEKDDNQIKKIPKKKINIEKY
ncbi:MAG: hypothetical protein Barrevirus29_2 [Barrevirus sp.]|uniref:Uncharacterized protein n=1 Tax=Barrevirus sp. TaxID=2487763 RepID=A0A3G4ZV47_9VIRU|nr:MAG: hypothetical protein Barrevirus29_2 [Barrevirus sp.]